MVAMPNTLELLQLSDLMGSLSPKKRSQYLDKAQMKILLLSTKVLLTSHGCPPQLVSLNIPYSSILSHLILKVGGQSVDVISGPIEIVDGDDKASDDHDAKNSEGHEEVSKKVIFSFISDRPADLTWDPRVGKNTFIKMSNILLLSSYPHTLLLFL